MAVAACSLLVMFHLTFAGSKDRGAELQAFFEEVDGNYPFFELKGNREFWDRAKPVLLSQASAADTDTAFVGVVTEALRYLRDSHVRVRSAAEAPARPRLYYPGLSFTPAKGQRVAVLWPGDYEDVLQPGDLITAIDGEPAWPDMEARAEGYWAECFCSSPQRARMLTYRIPLRGELGTTKTLTYERDGVSRTLEVSARREAQGWPHHYNLPEDLQKAGSALYHAQLDDGVGFMWLRRLGDDTPQSVLEAAVAHPAARGWIVDLRGNGGGGYSSRLVTFLAALPQPVAVLIDAGCISAGETLARDLRRAAAARLFGTPTAGASSAKYTWRFPSGVAEVVLPRRSRWRNDGQPIEFNGIQPDEVVWPEPADLRAGRNTELLRAHAWIVEQRRK